MSAQLEISADLANLEKIRAFVQETVSQSTNDQEAIEDLVLVVDEVATNVIVHGYGGKSGSIWIEIIPSITQIVVYIRDQGPPFDPTLQPNPQLNLPLEKRPFGKMGIFLLRLLTDRLEYRRTPQGMNELSLIKYIQES